MTSSLPIPSRSSDSTGAKRKPLIHPLSALLLVVIDSLWTIADFAAVAWAATIPLSFLAVFVPTYVIQKYLHKDPTGKSVAVAAFLGALAAVPTPITGTTVGAITLALAGFRSLGWKG